MSGVNVENLRLRFGALLWEYGKMKIDTKFISEDEASKQGGRSNWRVKEFNLEAHLVHESSDGKTAVIGIIYKIGRPRLKLYSPTIEKDLKALANTKGVERAIGRINPKQIKIGGKKYYRYIGSLTVPPCTEGVIWTMDRKVKTVTKRQMKLIRDAVHDVSCYPKLKF
ncbi:hypothetical protein H5410_034230 [Solanum commersonii]|uniref:Alpha-carbonic anhydrase domain-containing protein n=1 Tax=Solanum commersonii TaxID=4109 RepID=A0A9J5YUY7_SOLCO|nr:hypothetical protein H5410_034230 [Solanum commersonii]